MSDRPTRRVILTGAGPLLAASAAAARPYLFNAVDFGAAPGAASTAGLQKALDECGRNGGGTVVVPPGEYLTGPLEMRSGTVLLLEPGATIKGSPKLEDYGVEAAAVSGESVRAGLITARNAENVAITGRGTLDGNSMPFHDPNRLHAGVDTDKQYTRQKDDYRNPKYGTAHGPIAHGERPGNLVRFINCRNVLLEGVTVSNSPTWTIQFYRCDGVRVAGLNINSDSSGRRVPNDDGMDVRECANVRISDCNIGVGDDCIALFGSRNVAVSNCNLSSRSSAIRVNYTDGETRDCVFENLTIDSNCGLKINVRGRGSVENIQFSGIVMRTRLHTGHWWGQGEPLSISALRLEDGPLGHIRNVRVSGLMAESESGIILHGCPESALENIELDDIRLCLRDSALQPSYGGNFDLRATKDLAQGLFAHDIPGLFFRHVAGLTVRRFTLAWDTQAPPFFSHGIEGRDFRDIEIDGFVGGGAPGRNQAAILLADGSGVTVRNCRAAAGTTVFLSQQRVGNHGLFAGNDLAGAARAFDGENPGFVEAGNRPPQPRAV